MHAELRLLLDVPVPGKKLIALEKTAAKRAGQGHLTGWTGAPPAELLEKLAHLHTLMDADVPSGELSRDPVSYDAARVLRISERLIEQGYQLVTTLISDHSAEPAGYTMMLVMGGGGREVLQDSTFVLRSCRGRGLGTLARLGFRPMETTHELELG